MQEFEVPFLARRLIHIDWIGVALAQKMEVVGVLQFFDTVWIPAKLFVKMLNGPHVRRAAVPQFLFAIALDLLANIW